MGVMQSQDHCSFYCLLAFSPLHCGSSFVVPVMRLFRMLVMPASGACSGSYITVVRMIPRYPGDLLGISVNLEYQLGDLPGIRFCEADGCGFERDRDIKIVSAN